MRVDYVRFPHPSFEPLLAFLLSPTWVGSGARKNGRWRNVIFSHPDGLYILLYLKLQQWYCTEETRLWHLTVLQLICRHLAHFVLWEPRYLVLCSIVCFGLCKAWTIDEIDDRWQSITINRWILKIDEQSNAKVSVIFDSHRLSMSSIIDWNRLINIDFQRFHHFSMLSSKNL